MNNIDYNRLEKVEALGITGTVLSLRLANMYEEYLEGYKKFTDINMDCLSTEDDKFSQEIAKYNEMFDHFDHRMTTIIKKAFKLSPTVSSIFKNIFMFGPLLERTIIAPNVESCYVQLADAMHNELDECKLILDYHLDHPDQLERAVFKSLPKTAGAIGWSMQLLRRAMALMKPLENIDHP